MLSLVLIHDVTALDAFASIVLDALSLVLALVPFALSLLLFFGILVRHHRLQTR